MNAIELIAAERARQIEQKGYTPAHDDQHTRGELGDAAICYAWSANEQVNHRPGAEPLPSWPFADDAWQWSPDPLRNLVKAGALIVAEIERLQRRGA